MGYWQWANTEVLDEWEIGKSEAIRVAVYEAMFAALEGDAANPPGESVPFSKTGTLRITRTSVAAIYFNAQEGAWNAAHGKLVLSSIIDI